MPLKYAFGIDLTCDESEKKYIRSVRAYYEIASLSFYELKTHIQLDKTVTIYRTYKRTRPKVGDACSLDILQIWLRSIAYRRRNSAYNFFSTGVTTRFNNKSK